MRARDMRELPTEELKQKYEDLLKDYFGLRLKHAMGQLENPLVLRGTRRDIARAKTLMVEKGVPETTRRRRRTGAWVAKSAEAKTKDKEPRAARKKRGKSGADEG